MDCRGGAGGRGYNILLDFDDLVKNLLTSEERARKVPKFTRVLDDLEQLVSSRSTFSIFSFVVRLLDIKSHYRVSNNYFDALLALLSDAFPSSNIPKSWEEARKYIQELGLMNPHYCIELTHPTYHNSINLTKKVNEAQEPLKEGPDGYISCSLKLIPTKYPLVC